MQISYWCIQEYVFWVLDFSQSHPIKTFNSSGINVSVMFWYLYLLAHFKSARDARLETVWNWWILSYATDLVCQWSNCWEQRWHVQTYMPHIVECQISAFLQSVEISQNIYKRLSQRLNLWAIQHMNCSRTIYKRSVKPPDHSLDLCTRLSTRMIEIVQCCNRAATSLDNN